MKITNLTGRPVVLNDGTIVSAAGTRGSSKTVETLSDRDRKRLVDHGAVHVEETTTVAGAASGESKLGESKIATSRPGRSRAEGEL